MGNSCTTSADYASAYNVSLTDLPASVRAEAVRITKLPEGPQQLGAVKKLVVKLRRSELAKAAALKAAVRHWDKSRKHLSKRGRA